MTFRKAFTTVLFCSTIILVCLYLVYLPLLSKKKTNLLKLSAGMKHHTRNVQIKRILFYNPAVFQRVRNLRNLTYFRQCKVNACALTFEQSEASQSDAVILDWKTLILKPNFTRPTDQIWIFIQHEAPPMYWGPYPVFYENMKNTFNWTMTYSKRADIYLPYGSLERKSPNELKGKRDYEQIAKNKTKDAVWVASHCTTDSKREMYVDTLKKYIGVKTLGGCGKPWCGRPHDHEADNCFSILNSSYRYYLAFENNMCQDYITEKFYENYKYDILLVSRGGKPRYKSIDASEGAYIDTGDFTNAHALGFYLRDLKKNWTHYAEILAKKDEYRVISYPEMFQTAMCEVCERLHNLHKYKRTYKDVFHWMQTEEPCFYINDF